MHVAEKVDEVTLAGGGVAQPADGRALRVARDRVARDRVTRDREKRNICDTNSEPLVDPGLDSGRSKRLCPPPPDTRECP